MSRTRRLAGIAALAAASASVLVIPGAGAQTVEYGATSDGVGLDLSLFGQGLTAGKAHSELTSAPQAAAEGAGLANPLSPAGATSASVEGADATDGSADETCDSDALPPIPGLSIALACSSSIASIAGGNPSSTATGRVAGIEANPVGALLDTPLAEVVPPVQDGLDQLLGGLAPVLGPVGEGAGLDLEDTISDLLDSLLEGAPLATITLGPTRSSTTVADGTVTSECAASGGRVDILDPPPVAGAADLPPAISVIVGDAATSVVASTTSSDEDPLATADPAIVTVVVPSLGIDQPVGPGDDIEIPLPEPLGTSTISVAGGSTGTDDSGATFARASAVRLDLLNGEALMGGIELALADCLSVAGATVTAAPTPPAQPPAPASPPFLARTGADDPSGLALAATVGLAGLALALLRRTRVQ